MTTIAAVPKIERLLRKYASKGSKILDVGCGTGAYRFSTEADYTGLDVTDTAYSEGTPRVVDIVASASEIPVSDSTFELVFAVSAFYLIPDKEKVLAEFKRVLKPGGRLLLVDYNACTQRYLQDKENVRYPCWTQKELRDLIRTAGFGKTEILLPLAIQMPRFLKSMLIAYNETRLGGRAIVTGIKEQN